jgi:hypothetical protein
MTEKTNHYDVVVAGGGIAGTMAAIAAAEQNKKTIIIERYSALGGMATLGLVQPMTVWGCREKYIIGGMGKTLLGKVVKERPGLSTPVSLYGPVMDAEYLKYVLEKEALRKGVEILYHSWITGVEKQGDKIISLKCFSKSGEFKISGKVFVDGTGDADIASFSGVDFELGEQGVTLMFLAGGIDKKNCPSSQEMNRIYEENKVGYRDCTIFWHPIAERAYFNMTEVEGCDALSPESLTGATIECREQAWRILQVFNEKVPGFENAYIEQTAPALGVRETRRIKGLYKLTTDDILQGLDFEDTIVRASCPVDIHGAKANYQGLKKSYAVPYRCLVSEKVDNLIVTGRPISTDHGAHSSVRRMAPGFALGEAAGTAASLAVETGDARNISIKQLQDILIQHGAVLEPETND